MSTIPLDFNKPKKKAPKRALRFEIKLQHNGHKNEYTTVDFPELIQKMIMDKKTTDKDDHPFDEDENEIAATVAYFDEKYGRAQAFKYEINKGDGYIDEDSFIDDSEAYDEIIPPEMQTLRGGFYINCGDLELVQIPDSDDKMSIELEKAATLQQLKRKRKGSEFDADIPKPKKTNKIKTKPSSNNASKFIVSQLNENAPGTSQQKLSQQQTAISSSTSSSKNGKQTNDDDDDDIQIIGEKPPQKERKEESILTVPSSKPKKEQQTTANIIKTSTPDQMTKLINHFMNHPTDPNTESYHNLQKNLAIHKVPLDIIQKIPKAKVSPNGLLSNEWNRFLIEAFQKTSNNELIRSKLFEYLSQFLNIDNLALQTYSSTLVAGMKPAVKSSKTSQALPESLLSSNTNSKSPKTSSSTTPISATGQNLSSSTLTISTSNNNAYNNNSALNLSKNHSVGQNSGFSEGLASKLQTDRGPKALPKVSFTQAQMEAQMKAYIQTVQKSGNDKKINPHLFNTLMGSILVPGTGPATRPSLSNSPNTLASNSLLQPSNSKVNQTPNPVKNPTPPNLNTANNTANLLQSMPDLSAYANFIPHDVLRLFQQAPVSQPRSNK